MEDKNNYSDLIISTTTNDMSHYYPENETPSNPPYDYFTVIRLSIFFITAVCVGLPCLIWAFYFVHLQRKTRGWISAFIILLLLSDLLQLLLYPYIVYTRLSFRFPFGIDTFITATIYWYLKICSLHLQQLVALEGVLTLKYPQISAHIFSSPCYIIISIIILLFPSTCVLLLGFSGFHSAHFGFAIFLAPACLLVVTGIITYKAPSTPASTPATGHKPGALLFLVTVVTMVVLYLPYILVSYIHIIFFPIMSWYIMSYCLWSLTVISEPLLCVLVCRENLSIQTKQTHIELNSEQIAV